MKRMLILVPICLAVSMDMVQAEEVKTVRFATFNTSLNRKQPGQLISDLENPKHLQARRVAEILQRVRPDVVLLNEVDYDEKHQAALLLQNNFLAVGQNGQQGLSYEYSFLAESNTGISSGFDLNRDGKTDGPNDAFGFGNYPGQYGMLVLSKFPINKDAARTFQKFLWKDMPGAMLPTIPGTKESYYSDDVLNVFRLSSKSHWDLQIQIGDSAVHFLCSHPTPPVFDGPEDRHGKRNHDEIRFWADYVSDGKSGYIYDDQGNKGGLKPGQNFIVAGDMNADPNDGDSTNFAIRQLSNHPAIDAGKVPTSKGAVQAAETQGRANRNHKSSPAADTGDFSDFKVGNLRLDYVLPSKSLKVIDAGVYWPRSDEDGHELLRSSDHRLVWIDIQIP